eukprot:jgi/Tetstr1/466092/TSEL_010676.t1
MVGYGGMAVALRARGGRNMLLQTRGIPANEVKEAVKQVVATLSTFARSGGRCDPDGPGDHSPSFSFGYIAVNNSRQLAIYRLVNAVYVIVVAVPGTPMSALVKVADAITGGLVEVCRGPEVTLDKVAKKYAEVYVIISGLLAVGGERLALAASESAGLMSLMFPDDKKERKLPAFGKSRKSEPAADRAASTTPRPSTTAAIGRRSLGDGLSMGDATVDAPLPANAACGRRSSSRRSNIRESSGEPTSSELASTSPDPHSSAALPSNSNGGSSDEPFAPQFPPPANGASDFFAGSQFDGAPPPADPAWAEEASFDTSWPEAAPAKEPPNSGFDAAWPEPSDIAEQPSFGQPQAPSPAQESGFGASWPDFAESAPRMPAPESNFEASWPDFGAGHQQAPDLSDSSFHSERAPTKSLSASPAAFGAPAAFFPDEQADPAAPSWNSSVSAGAAAMDSPPSSGPAPWSSAPALPGSAAMPAAPGHHPPPAAPTAGGPHLLEVYVYNQELLTARCSMDVRLPPGRAAEDPCAAVVAAGGGSLPDVNRRAIQGAGVQEAVLKCRFPPAAIAPPVLIQASVGSPPEPAEGGLGGGLRRLVTVQYSVSPGAAYHLRDAVVQLQLPEGLGSPVQASPSVGWSATDRILQWELPPHGLPAGSSGLLQAVLSVREEEDAARPPGQGQCAKATIKFSLRGGTLSGVPGSAPEWGAGLFPGHAALTSVGLVSGVAR